MVDELQAREQSIRQLREESLNLRVELQEQVALLSEFEIRFRQQSEGAQKEIDTLRAQLSQKDVSNGKKSQSRHFSGQDGEAESALLAEAEQAVKVLASEKVQLLEAYELLEEDTGRLIDEAVDKQNKRVRELEEDLKVCTRVLQCKFMLMWIAHHAKLLVAGACCLISFRGSLLGRKAASSRSTY